ncbi:PREDICTED: uncharacterized protein LOC104745682 [Camelina sativa]|uniref:Uncharacterized protein LOC104712228 n=1 Tax=Camelina sativa TaxID=90675 RepID=A0ABM0W3T7_CAMSA|nr:PREDICTED: uncharacterized protein LOC104712228 [Camelina sativa]XP_010465292.1 PREDICTED: uncharacterized protein LOC104745682 [Camelina sativa]
MMISPALVLAPITKSEGLFSMLAKRTFWERMTDQCAVLSILMLQVLVLVLKMQVLVLKFHVLVVDELITNFNTGRTKSYKWRISQLQNISKMLGDKEKCIT